MVYCTSFDSKIGLIYVASTDKGVCKISVPKQTRRDFFRWLHDHFADHEVADNKSRNKEVIDQIEPLLQRQAGPFHLPDRPDRDPVSVARLERAHEDSLRDNDQLQAACPAHRNQQGVSGRRARKRLQPTSHHRSLPPRPSALMAPSSATPAGSRPRSSC